MIISTVGQKVNYYDLLGIEVGASIEEVKAAFRRRAKELHPDVNNEDDAEEAFIQVNTAYETLADEGRRLAYNRLHGLGGRRMNFFQDVDIDLEEQPFLWKRRSAARPDDFGDPQYEDIGGSEDDEFLESSPFGRDFRQRWRQQSKGGFRWSDLGHDADELASDDGSDAELDDPEQSAKEAAAAEAKQLEALLSVLGRMNANGITSKDWGSGRMDPCGTTTSEAWHRKVEQQKLDPFPSRGGFGPQQGPPFSHPEWMPPGRPDNDDGPGRIGWMPPGRGMDDSRRGGSSRRWGGDDGGFSGRPL